MVNHRVWVQKYTVVRTAPHFSAVPAGIALKKRNEQNIGKNTSGNTMNQLKKNYLLLDVHDLQSEAATNPSKSDHLPAGPGAKKVKRIS